MSKGRIEGDMLTVTMRNKSILTVEAVDPQMVADIIFSHDPSSEIVKGKIGIKSVAFVEHVEEKGEAKTQLIDALKKLLDDVDE